MSAPDGGPRTSGEPVEAAEGAAPAAAPSEAAEPQAAAPPPPAGDPCLVFEDLSVEGPEGLIIAPSSVTLRAGEICLVVGLSGAGKTLLSHLVLGSLPAETEGVTVSGRILLDGQDLLEAGAPEVRSKLGAVFQLHQLGLFDDLTVDQNIGFASRGPVWTAAARWRKDLFLEDAPNDIAQASGGQRQRIALARTLERGAEILLFDEPTTGLDPDAAARTVDLIRSNHRRLTIVVTHDFASFRPIVDRVILIDPVTRRLEDVTGAADIGALLRGRAAESTRLPRFPERPTIIGRAVRSAVTWWTRTALSADRLARDALAILLTGPAYILRVLIDWRIRRQAGAILYRFLSPGTIAFVGVAAGLIGLVTTFFVYDRLPMRAYTEPLLLEDLLKALGFAIFRVLGPLFATILVSAKVGASITASVGTMSYQRQIDALRLLDVPPRHYLLWPIVSGFVIGMLVLAGFAIIVASGVSAVIFLHFHPTMTPAFWWRYFWMKITLPNLYWVLAKTTLSAIGAGIIAYDSGATPKRSSEAIGTSIHRTILWSLLWVLVVHASFSFFEFPPTPAPPLNLLE